MPVHDRDANDRLEPFELSHNECSMGPGTGQADEEVVATLFGGELGTGFAGDSIAEGGLRWSVVRTDVVGGGVGFLRLCEQTRRSSCLPTP